jgi:hypothetical protein
VPAGTAIGGTATGFFCGAVATGSSLLTALVRDPSPVYIGFAVLLVLLLWLTSRTRWHPSAPLRLERRRAWGSIVNAARRMYFGHLRLFLAIGLLFFPLGAVITACSTCSSRSAAERTRRLSRQDERGGRFLCDRPRCRPHDLRSRRVECATAIAMVEIDAGRKVSPVEAYRKTLSKLGTLLGTVLIAAVIVAIVGLTTIGVLLAIWLGIKECELYINYL